MNQEIKERWAAALESGEYQQGRGALVRKSATGNLSYCCLGVLCELAVADGVIEPAVFFSDREEFGGAVPGEYAGSQGLPPRVVMEWAGASANEVNWSDFGVAVPGTTYQKDYLATLNDTGHPFTVIAQAIREHL